MSTGNSWRTRLLCLLVVLPLLAGLATWTPAAEAAPRGHRTTVTIALSSPGAATRVVTRLQARGFRIVRVTGWAVTATAPPRVVATTLGRHRSAARARTVLGSGVQGVVPQQPGLLQPMATTSGSDYRNAYAATPTSGVARGNEMSTGAQAGSTTVATIQFAQFDASDLSRYAASQNLPDPVASGQYTGVLVDDGPSTADGAVEVALDQQAILATSPTARQRAYFAPNTTSGFADALQDVARDAVAFHITALSISWGNCESQYPAISRSVLDQAMANVVQQGVTIFSSSGDSGVYACRSSAGTSSRVDVTYPASSPQVVGVGGTQLSPTGTSARNTGVNWTERAWSCVDLASCSGSGTGGSGGGASTAYARPSWQSGVTNGTKRLVPDIAAVGDPTTGFVITLCGTRYLTGGTSLSSPVAAALLTDALSEAGWTTGVGDIHANLYQATASTFRDITSGSNGPSSNAGPGYDTVTGLGAVLWPKLVDTYYPTPSTAPSSLPAASANTVTWPLCTTGATPTPTSTGSSSTTSGTPTPTPGPTAQIALSQRRIGRERVRVVARWTVVARSTVALAATRVVLTDLTSGRVLARAASLRGVRAAVVPAGHRVSLVVVPQDVNGAGSAARVVRRVR